MKEQGTPLRGLEELVHEQISKLHVQRDYFFEMTNRFSVIQKPKWDSKTKMGFKNKRGSTFVEVYNMNCGKIKFDRKRRIHSDQKSKS